MLGHRNTSPVRRDVVDVSITIETSADAMQQVTPRVDADADINVHLSSSPRAGQSEHWRLTATATV